MSRAFHHEPWIYRGQPLLEVPAGADSFVYLLTDIVTGMMYVGKKTFWSLTTVKHSDPNKKPRKARVESEWRKYYSSNSEIIAAVKGGNGKRFTREILHLCRNKGSANYLEAREIFDRRCLEHPNLYMNRYISVEANCGHLKLEEFK